MGIFKQRPKGPQLHEKPLATKKKHKIPGYPVVYSSGGYSKRPHVHGPKVEKLSPAATFLGSALPFQLFRCLMMPSAINWKNCAVSPNASMKVISSVMWVN